MNNRIVQNIAHKIYLENKEVLECALNEQELTIIHKIKPDGYYISNNKITFLSFDDRDYYVSMHYFLEIDGEHTDSVDLVMSTAFTLWEQTLYGASTLSGLFLSMFDGRFNILELLLQSNRNPYGLTSVADQYIKHAKLIDVKEIFNFFSVVFHQNKNYVGKFCFLEQRLTNDFKKCQEILSFYYSNIQADTLHLYNIALFSMAKKSPEIVIPILMNDIKKDDPIVSPQSLRILGKVIERNGYKGNNGEILSVINDSLSSPIALVSNAAVQATIDMVNKVTELRIIIRSLLNVNDHRITELLGQSLAINRGLLSDDDFPFWITSLCKAHLSNDNSIGFIFKILTELSKSKVNHKLLIECITMVIQNHSLSKKSDGLDLLLHEITKNPLLLNKIATLTLVDENSESPLFTHVISDYLFIHRGEHKLECCLELINDFKEQDFIFLVRRILGFITHETHLVSMILSLLSTTDSEKRTFNIVKDVMLNELVVDYPEFVREEIKRRKELIPHKRKKLHRLYDEILSKIDVYISSFSVLPRIKEFESPSFLVSAFQKEKDKVATKNNDLYENDSIVFKIASRVILKAGVGSFYYNEFNNEGYSQPSYLHTFSSSYSLPRRYVMDNIGYDIRIAQFRSAKKDVL